MCGIHQYWEDREKANELIMENAGLGTKRFFNLDSNVYKSGALDEKTKELLGLVSSFVLRCDDCVSYHLVRCRQKGVSDEEMEEALAIGLIVGGSITIPHMRRAFKAWEQLKEKPIEEE